MNLATKGAQQQPGPGAVEPAGDSHWYPRPSTSRRLRSLAARACAWIAYAPCGPQAVRYSNPEIELQARAGTWQAA